MGVPNTVTRRVQWFQQRVGRELTLRVDALLKEFQHAVPGVSISSGARVEDVLIGGSFLDHDTAAPEDIDIGVVTDNSPAEAVLDGFWRFVNEQTVLDIPLGVDCVWVRSLGEMRPKESYTHQYSVVRGETTTMTAYLESTASEETDQ